MVYGVDQICAKFLLILTNADVPDGSAVPPEFQECALRNGDIAATLAAGSGTRPRDLDPRLIQRELLGQGAYLSPSIEALAAPASNAAE